MHAVQRLDAVHERGSILLFQDVGTHLDHVVRPDSEKVAIERGMVQLAERQAVLYHRRTLRLGVGHDVRRVEQLAGV